MISGERFPGKICSIDYQSEALSSALISEGTKFNQDKLRGPEFPRKKRGSLETGKRDALTFSPRLDVVAEDGRLPGVSVRPLQLDGRDGLAEH